MDQSVPVRYVFILYESESDNTSKHYTVILIILFYVFYVALSLTVNLSICDIILLMFFTYFNVNTGMVWLYVDKIYFIYLITVQWCGCLHRNHLCQSSKIFKNERSDLYSTTMNPITMDY